MYEIVSTVNIDKIMYGWLYNTLIAPAVKRNISFPERAMPTNYSQGSFFFFETNLFDII